MNDDWRYAWPVHAYLANGQFTNSVGYAPNVLIHQLHAVLLSETGVFPSFTWLRCLTLLFSFLTVLVMERMLHLLQAGKAEKYTLIALLCFNPIYFSISFSYMTDIPFLFYACCSIWSYLLYFKNGEKAYRIMGFVLATLAFLVRQPGILIPFAFEGALLLTTKSKKQLFHFSLTALILVAVYGSVQFLVRPQLGLDIGPQAEQRYLAYLLNSPHRFGFRLLKYNVMAVFFLGFFLLPVAGYLVRWAYPKLGIKGAAMLLLAHLLIALALGLQDRYFPFGGNYIHASGLGPLLLSDVRRFGANPMPALPKELLFGLGLISQVNGTLLFWKGCYFIYSKLRVGEFPNTLLFLLLLLMTYMLAMTVFSFFDRYLLLPLVLVLLFLVRSSWKPRFTTLIYIFLITWISIAGTHDYLQWNRAAYRFYSDLTSANVPVEHIDGGVALNGYNLGNTSNKDAKFRISFSALPHHEIIEVEAFCSWLSGKQIAVFLLSTTPSPSKPPQTPPSAPPR